MQISASKAKTKMVDLLESKPERAHAYVRDGWWPNRTLLDYFDAAVAFDRNKIAIVSQEQRVSYGDLAVLVEKAARGLWASGIRPGDVISVQLQNSIEFVVVHLAATRLGAVTNPLLPNYRSKELEYILNFARTKVVVIPSVYRGFDYPKMYVQLARKLPHLLAIFVVGGSNAAGLRSFNSLYSDGEFDAAPASPDAISSLIFTSGTESTPKGVVHSHNTMLYGTVHLARVIGLGRDDIIWIPSPVGHGTGFQWGVRQAVTLGATMVLQDMWNAEEALRLIQQERCTFVLSATPFVQMLLDAYLKTKPDVSSLRVFGCAGAPIPRRLGALARDAMGCKLIGMWGMTECFVASTSAPSDPEAKLWETDGRAVPGGELAIFDETRTRLLEPGEIGELATRGPHVALGYFNDPERTRATFSDEGWLFSNDLATIDADGFIRIVGRKKDIINRGGLKFSAREIEDILIEHPAVAKAALVGLPDDRVGEKACVCVVLSEGRTIALKDVVEYLSARGLAKYKMPEFIAWIEDLPMTPSGKVQKFRLKDDILAGTIKAVSMQ